MLKSETLTVRAVIGAYESLFRKKIKLRNPTCDESCISTSIQDGGQLMKCRSFREIIKPTIPTIFSHAQIISI